MSTGKWLGDLKGGKYSPSPAYKPSSCRLFKDLNVDSHVQLRQTWVSLQLALHLLLLTTLQPCCLPPPLPPPVCNSSCLFTRCQSLYTSCCAILGSSLYAGRTDSQQNEWNLLFRPQAALGPCNVFVITDNVWCQERIERESHASPMGK